MLSEKGGAMNAYEFAREQREPVATFVDDPRPNRHARRYSDMHTALLVPALSLLLLNASAIHGIPLNQPKQQRNDPTVAQEKADVRSLELGTPIEREMKGGESHSYRFTLTAGQYLHLVVDQRGVDVIVTLFGPDGKQIVDVDSPNGTKGAEPVSWVADSSGGYLLEIQALEKTAAPGRYEVKIEELRPSIPNDRARVAAQAAFADGTHLQALATPEALTKAAERFEEALRLWRTVGDHIRGAYTAGYLAGIYSSMGQNQKALGYLNQELVLYRSVLDRDGEATTLTGIGEVYSALGEKQKALESFSQALPLRRAAGDRAGEAQTLNNIGVVYDSLGEKQKALEYYGQALPLYRTVGNRGDEAITLNNIGVVYSGLGEKQKALEYFGQALGLKRAVGDRAGEALSLANIGRVYDDLGEKQKALEYYGHALPLFRAAGDHGDEANTLSNIGEVYDSLGEKQKALEYYDQALSLSRAVGDRRGEAIRLNNIGLVYDSLGEKQKALEYYDQALPLLRATGDRTVEATTLNNIGVVYDSLGEKQKALDYYGQALPLYRALGNRQGEANTLANIGEVYSSLGEKQKALDYYGQSLPLSRTIGDRRREAISLSNIGLVYYGLGDKQKALDYYGQALPLYRTVGDRRGEAVTLNNIGLVYGARGEKQKALEYFGQALPLSQSVGDRGQEALGLYHIAVVERDRGNLVEARRQIEAALAITENLRSKYTNKQLGSSYFATVQDYYKFYIDLLMRLHKQDASAGFDAEALHVSERARARALLDSLSEAGADIRQGVDPTLVERERSLKQQLAAEESTQTGLLSKEHTPEQAAAITKEIEALTVQYQEIEAKIRAGSPRYAALTQPQPLSLKEIQQQVLDSDTLLLDYSLGEDRSYLWAVTPDSITSYELPKRSEIEEAARQVYALFTKVTEWRQSVEKPRGLGLSQSQSQRVVTTEAAKSSAPEAASRLSRMLLSPVSAQLGKKRLVIVADGALQFIPFSALPTPTAGEQSGAYQPLILDHELVSLPSASTLAVLRREVRDRQPAAKWLAVIADPIFDRSDERLQNGTTKPATVNTEPAEARGLALLTEQVTKAAKESGVPLNGLSIPRLPGTRREADAIMQLVPSGEGKEALDLAASRQTVASEELGHYRYLHFATHGFLDSEQPELSGIVLSMVDEHGRPQDGFLRAHQIFNLKLPAEMVVLSACETGLGKDVKGEGVINRTNQRIHVRGRAPCGRQFVERQ
jgi:tetratricopeptide (TPR) repeat protein/CHAT domain-containing protein